MSDRKSCIVLNDEVTTPPILTITSTGQSWSTEQPPLGVALPALKITREEQIHQEDALNNAGNDITIIEQEKNLKRKNEEEGGSDKKIIKITEPKQAWMLDPKIKTQIREALDRPPSYHWLEEIRALKRPEKNSIRDSIQIEYNLVIQAVRTKMGVLKPITNENDDVFRILTQFYKILTVDNPIKLQEKLLIHKSIVNENQRDAIRAIIFLRRDIHSEGVQFFKDIFYDKVEFIQKDTSTTSSLVILQKDHRLGNCDLKGYGKPKDKGFKIPYVKYLYGVIGALVDYYLLDLVRFDKDMIDLLFKWVALYHLCTCFYNWEHEVVFFRPGSDCNGFKTECFAYIQEELRLRKLIQAVLLN